MDQALEAAMQVFWKQGYEGTSVDDLAVALGIGKPSLYAAFGNKQAIYEKAVHRYSHTRTLPLLQALDQPDARQAALDVLLQTIKLTTCTPNQLGCLVTSGLMTHGSEACTIRQIAMIQRQKFENLILQRFKKAQREHQLPSSINPADIARWLLTVQAGLAMEASQGTPKAKLTRTANLAMQAWPR